MNKKSLLLSTVILSSSFLAGCSNLMDKPVTEIRDSKIEPVAMNNYPTRDRVEYVFNCIAKHGGRLDYVIQYSCGCKIDKIAEQLTFAEYEAASTFTMLRSTPGEKGAVFRDPAQSKNLRTRLKEAEANAEKSCFVK